MLCTILYTHTYTFLFSARAFCSFNQSKHESFTFTSREVAHNNIYLGNNIFYFCLCSILQCVLVHFCTDEFSSTILADAMMTVIIRNITRVCIKWIHSTDIDTIVIREKSCYSHAHSCLFVTWRFEFVQCTILVYIFYSVILFEYVYGIIFSNFECLYVHFLQ